MSEWSREQLAILTQIAEGLETIEKRLVDTDWGLGGVRIHLGGELVAEAFPADWGEFEFVVRSAREDT